VSERRHQRARAAVVPLPAPGERLALLRVLPTGRSLLVGFAIVACAVGLYALARVTPMFAVQRIEVEGAPPDVAAHVRAALTPLEGKSLLELDSAAVNRALGPLTDVSAAHYDRDFPHTLRVFVRAEQPVAVARRGADAWLVSASARVISTVPLGTHRSLPRVWLTGAGDPEPGAALADHPALRAIRALARARRAGFDRRVLSVRAGGHELTFLLASGLELRLGDLRAIPLKLAVAADIIPTLQQSGGYGYLDVSVPGRPVAGVNSQPEG
jgi:cell division septal protein FtsQ